MESQKAVVSLGDSTPEALLAAVIESSDDAIIAESLDGEILSWNRGAQRMFGYTPSEAIGKPISLIVPEDRLYDMRRILDAIAKGEPMDHFETQRSSKDGRILDVSITISPIRDESGRIIGASKIARDITNAKRVERETQERADRIQALYDAARTIQASLDPKLVYESLREIVLRVIPSDAVLVSSYSQDDRMIRAQFACIEGVVTDVTNFPAMPLAPEGKGFQSTVIRTGRPLLVDELQKKLGVQSVNHFRVTSDGELAGEPEEGQPQTQSMLLVPVVLEHEVIGVVQVSSHREHAYSQDDLELLEGLAFQLAASLKNVELFQRMTESEARFRLLANAMPQIAWSLDANGKMDFLNARYTEYSGSSADQAIKSAGRDVIHPDERKATDRSLAECLAAGQIWEREIRLKRKDGVYRWHLARLVPVFDQGRLVRWFGTSTDIDEKKHAEERAKSERQALRTSREELRRLNAELEERVTQRTKELVEANLELEGFTHSVSHDLRAPLRAIMSGSMIMLEDFSEALPEEAKANLLRQASAARKLAALIDDLLQYSRLGRKTIQKQPVDLSETSCLIVDDIERRHSDRQVSWLIADGLTANGDPELVRMLLQNLLENAFKFTARQEAAVIEVGMDAEGFFVRDNGVGFDMQYVHKLFRPFERLHRDVDYTGTGIGLANVKRIVERHGGTVWAESEGGKGATFHFTLPS